MRRQNREHPVSAVSEGMKKRLRATIGHYNLVRKKTSVQDGGAGLWTYESWYRERDEAIERWCGRDLPGSKRSAG